MRRAVNTFYVRQHLWLRLRGQVTASAMTIWAPQVPAEQYTPQRTAWHQHATRSPVTQEGYKRYWSVVATLHLTCIVAGVRCMAALQTCCSPRRPSKTTEPTPGKRYFIPGKAGPLSIRQICTVLLPWSRNVGAVQGGADEKMVLTNVCTSVWIGNDVFGVEVYSTGRQIHLAWTCTDSLIGIFIALTELLLPAGPTAVQRSPHCWPSHPVS